MRNSIHFSMKRRRIEEEEFEGDKEDNSDEDHEVSDSESDISVLEDFSEIYDGQEVGEDHEERKDGSGRSARERRKNIPGKLVKAVLEEVFVLTTGGEAITCPQTLEEGYG